MTRMIPNNQITLLQNGEAYFPAMEAALDRQNVDSCVRKIQNTLDKNGLYYGEIDNLRYWQIVIDNKPS